MGQLLLELGVRSRGVSVDVATYWAVRSLYRYERWGMLGP
jgi:hypothetical protein